MIDIDDIRIHFDPDQLLVINLCLGFLMFSVALDLEIKDFKLVLEKPKSVLVGLSSQLILLPIFTLVLIYLWHPPASVAFGLVLVAACPGGNISNYCVHVARGSTALSIVLTTIATVSAVVLTPLLFGVLTSVLSTPDSISTNISVSYVDMGTIILYLLLIPLLLGMTINYFFSEKINFLKKKISTFALLLFGGFIVGAILSNLDIIRLHLHHVVGLVIIHNLGAMCIGYLYSTRLGLSYPERKAVTFETGIQNSGLGLVIIFNFFTDLGGMMLVAAWWGIWDMLSALIISLLWRNR